MGRVPRMAVWPRPGKQQQSHVLRSHTHPRRAPAQPQESRPRHPHGRDDRGHRAQRLRQVQPRLRHPLRRGPAALRRDLQRLRAPVPRPHGPPGRGPRGRRPARDRHRPDQPCAHQPQHGRHDDRAERPPEAAVRARGAALRPRHGAAGPARLRRNHLHRPERPRRRGGRPSPGLHLPGGTAGRHHGRAAGAMAGRERLHASAGRAHRGRPQDPRRGGRPPAPGRRRARACARGHRARAQARRRAPHGARGARGRGATLAVEIQHRPALPGKRPALRRSAACALQLQLGLRRLRDLPRLRPGDRCRLGPGGARPPQDPAQRRHQDPADARLEGLPGRPAQVRGRGRHSARHRLDEPHRRTARVGSRGLAALEGRLEQAVVRRAPVLRVPGEQGLQDAHPRALVQVPQLHALRRLRGRAPQAGGPALARGFEGRCRCGAAAGPTLPARGRGLVARAAGGAARPGPERPDAALDRAPAPILRRADAAAARRRAVAAARRDPDASEIPLRRWPAIPDAGPPEPHAQRRRGAAHQPHHRARHLAREHDVRAGRAQHRPAPP